MHSTQVTLLICILRTQFGGRYNVKCGSFILRTVTNLLAICRMVCAVLIITIYMEITYIIIRARVISFGKI